MRQFTLAACVIGVSLAACDRLPERSASPVLPSNTLTIHTDGTILWNGIKIDADTLGRLCKEATERKPQPEVHIEPDRLARYDTVAKIIAEMQKTGCGNIGFTGIDQSN